MKILIAFALALFLVAAAPARARLPDIARNDNTHAGGRLAGDVLRLALVAERGMWYPDGSGTVGLPVDAFGEVGKPLQVPGPLVRVPLGTHVVVTVRNELARELTLHGPAGTMVHVAVGATKALAFAADTPGAYGYYGADDRNSRSETLDSRIFRDAELSGAVIVEKKNAPKVDHVFVLGMYAPIKQIDGSPNFIEQIETINGRSFPATEHLTYERGQTIRWAVYNASAMAHPMHLHGFYYRLDGADQMDQVTHAFRPGEANELTWTADRAGNWMFHCHISDHITPHSAIREILAHRPHKGDINLAAVAKRFHNPGAPMAGMVIALRVTPQPGDRAPVAATAPRELALSLEAQRVAKPTYPGMDKGSIVLTDGTTKSVSTGSLGPPIVLAKDEPVAIAVTNHTSEQSSIHWHGIALADSYFDGGAGMGMAMHGERMSPPIDPGSTFVARFAPPDAGTFMYHAHMDDGWQLGSGFNGPLVVMPAGTTFDPVTDHIVMIAEAYERAGSPFVAINGSLAPDPIVMQSGVAQRLRFAELTLAGENYVVSLSDGERVLRWTPIAKDGRDLPRRLQREANATNAMTIGETRDFTFTPTHPGPLLIGVYDLDNGGMLVAHQSIDVR